MSKRIANTVRAAFALFMLGMGLYAGVDRLTARELAGRGPGGACGSAETPCALAPLTVTTPRTSARMVSVTVPARAALHAAAES